MVTEELREEEVDMMGVVWLQNEQNLGADE